MEIACVLRDLNEYQKAMGYDFSAAPWSHRIAVLRDYVTALHVEQAEMLQELPWKPWKTYEENCYANLPSKAVDEWMDCFVFLIDQALCLQLSVEDIEQSYKRTMVKLHERVASGYSKTQRRKRYDHTCCNHQLPRSLHSETEPEWSFEVLVLSAIR